MSEQQQTTAPRIAVIAGPNGAGKSTFAADVLARLQIDVFVNADIIAAELAPHNVESAALEAGRIMLKRLRELTANRQSLAFETTLATRSFAPWIAEQKQLGYEFDLEFLWVPDPQLSILRVADRVRHGGHFVPPETIIRRYHRGLHNLRELYIPLANRWEIYDNSGGRPAQLIAKNIDGALTVLKPHEFRTIMNPLGA